MIHQLDMLRGWLRHAGWRNVYWREDTYSDHCPHLHLHEDELLAEPDYHRVAICIDCGKLIREH